MKINQDQIHFVLVEPQEPGNIGASARAIKNMGFSRLELINPVNFHTPEARWLACHSLDILEKAVVYSTLNEALKNKTMVVGMTRRRSKDRGIFLPFKAGIKRIAETAEENRTAVLFGRENDGLTNQELEACAFLLSIPSNPDCPTLNLAQSVLLTAYELSRASLSGVRPKFVSESEKARLYKRIQFTLQILDYYDRGNRELGLEIHRNLKRLLNRAGLTEWELNMLLGMCSRIEQKLKN